jgi:molybdopterin molybdotransferase
MINVQEALNIIESCSRDFGLESVPLINSLGRVLAEDIYADRDLPPYDKVMMDGIAISYDSYSSGLKSFKIEDIAPAGKPQIKLKDKTSCIEIMTGAILPLGTDAVIRYEDIQIKNNYAILDDKLQINPNQNIHPRAKDQKANELLLKSGHAITSSSIAVAATLGKSQLLVKKTPRILLVSTGDELIEIHELPLIHQVRKSNIYQTKAALENWGLYSDMEHLKDDQDIIKNKLSRYLEEYDVIILSGGVSKGKFDHIPESLQILGLKQHIYKIAQRPGKPFWFGTTKRCTVFALPGNPISSFLCLNRYFKYWLDSCSILHKSNKEFAILSKDVQFNPDLTYFLKVKTQVNNNAELIASPIEGTGSGDLVSLINADGFLQLPRGKDLYKAGEIFELIAFH